MILERFFTGFVPTEIKKNAIIDNMFKYINNQIKQDDEEIDTDDENRFNHYMRDTPKYRIKHFIKENWTEDNFDI